MAGCHRPATSELCTELQRAEALMYPHPDSALHLLQAMDVPGMNLIGRLGLCSYASEVQTLSDAK